MCTQKAFPLDFQMGQVPGAGYGISWISWGIKASDDEERKSQA